VNYLIAFLEQEVAVRETSLDERYINEARQALAEAIKAKKLMEAMRKQLQQHAARQKYVAGLVESANRVLR
jgi:hypothetical protein